ncbi:hypothetical protein [Rhodococcus sp. AH-ZY2]|uniref:hypothetical protein n=1 Tax=Rhodococcus sp. AH-ZY2 TaxID=3047468 RepID=UPI0027E1C668|nr:hypothetical protein [Rhodococcus sp. AH-ZY2]WML63641.1 hypothetical protein QNA09_02145 [Rhodococcus sp. AH-ZY2]
MSETFYLPREQQAELTELLDTIPALIDDLTITIAKQDRLGNGPRISRGKTAQPLPFNVNASEAADQLHNELASWVRHTCEHRTMSYDSSNDTLSLTRWLKRWIIALALSPGSEEALPAIRAAIHHARRATDRPATKRTTSDDGHTLEDVALTKAELREALNIRLGITIKRQTLDSWIRRKRITPIEGEEHYYSLREALAVVKESAGVVA